MPNDANPVREVKMHYTDMTGHKANPGKVPISAFEIENQQRIVTCPTGQLPTRSDWNPKGHVLSAHFQVDICMACPLRNTCPVKFQKQDTILRVSQKAVIAPDVRAQMQTPGERRAWVTRSGKWYGSECGSEETKRKKTTLRSEIIDFNC